MNLNIKTLTVSSPDGHEIPVLLNHSNLSSDSIAVITHGIFTDKREKGRFDRLTERLSTRGINSLRFDFRGHGESLFPTEKFTISGALTDYISILNWVENNNFKKIVTIGSSFGGSIILLEKLLPNSKDIICTVLINPVVDYSKTFINPILEWGKEILNIEKIKKAQRLGSVLLTNKFNCSIDFINQLCIIKPGEGFKYFKNSVLVLHGDKDDKVPLESIKLFADRYNIIKLKIVKGGGHAFKDPLLEKYVHKEIIDWVLISLGENHE